MVCTFLSDPYAKPFRHRSRAAQSARFHLVPRRIRRRADVSNGQGDSGGRHLAWPFKWSPLVVDAFHAVARTRPDLWLLLVGAPDDIQRAVAELPASINSRVRCIDRLYERELAACYAALDIFVHAARHGESFGNVLCEAMFSGVAVLTLATPEVDNGQAQLVRDAGGGVIAYSEAGFMKALEALCERPDWRRELAQRGRSGVERCFGAEQIIDAALRFFVNEVARRKKAVAARNNGAERSRECVRWKEEAAATMSECWEGDMAKTVGWIRARAIAERAVGRSRWETMARLVRGYRLHR